MESQTYVWCRVCHRCSKWDASPLPLVATRCSCSGCKARPGSLLLWEHVRRFHPKLPLAPSVGAHYPLQLLLWCPKCKHVFDAAKHGKHCPTKVCVAGSDTHFILWRAVRAAHPIYPEEPEPTQTYWYNLHPDNPEPAYRRFRTGDSTFSAKKDHPRSFEVVCARCETINNKNQKQARCLYCGDLLPVPKKRAGDLRRDLHSSHWSNYHQVINETNNPDRK